MADNIDVTPGVGKTVATDDVAGVHYQKVKPVFGADGVAPTPVDETHGLPVEIVEMPAVVVTGGATSAKQDTMIAHLDGVEGLLAQIAAGVGAADGSATSSVADSATVATLLAANVNRIGASVYNDSMANLYLKLGSGASLTDYTVKLGLDDYYEVPAGYQGAITGIWSSDAGGAARVTELT